MIYRPCQNTHFNNSKPNKTRTPCYLQRNKCAWKYELRRIIFQNFTAASVMGIILYIYGKQRNVKSFRRRLVSHTLARIQQPAGVCHNLRRDKNGFMWCGICIFQSILKAVFFSVKPFFNKEPQDVEALAGQRVTFKCLADGDPPPNVIWRRDDGKMPLGRVSVQEDKSLQIENVQTGDEGLYICNAENIVGIISTKASLVVNCKYISF